MKLRKFNVMLDVETLSTKPNAAVIAVGATAFSCGDGVISEYDVLFYENVTPHSDAHIDADTVRWWMQPDKDCAREHLLTCSPVSEYALCSRFTSFLAEFCKGDYDNLTLWGNGANFDNVILRSMYERTGLKMPVTPFRDGCYRTVKNMHPDSALKPLPNSNAHNALADAQWQMNHLINIYQNMRPSGISDGME